MRLLLADDETDQSLHARVFGAVRFLLCNRLALGRPVSYVDATHLTPAERKPYFDIAKIWNCDVEALYFRTPLEICRERNRGRSRVVPEEALERMAAKLCPPALEEGFARITVVEPEGRPAA
jgi:predicted kinase